MKIILSILGVIVVITAFLYFDDYLYNKEKQKEINEGERMSLVGTYLCLPPKDETNTTADCAIGIKTDEGVYYALDLGLLSSDTPVMVDQDRIEAQGIVTPLERLSTDYWQKYPVVGIFSVTDSLKVITKSQNTDSTDEVLLGIFEGVLPCASCSGIKTKVTLYKENEYTSGGRYILSEVYLDENKNAFVSEGEWVIERGMEGDIDASVYALYNAQNTEALMRYVKIDKDTIRLIGKDSSALPSQLPYNLTKVKESILDSSWIWDYTLLQDIARIEAGADQKFILSFPSENEYNSTTDCNSLSGALAIDQEVLSFGPAMSTKMFCENSQEQEYVRDLLLTNSYSIEGDTLLLNLNRDYGTMVFTRKKTE